MIKKLALIVLIVSTQVVCSSKESKEVKDKEEVRLSTIEDDLIALWDEMQSLKAIKLTNATARALLRQRIKEFRQLIRSLKEDYEK